MQGVLHNDNGCPWVAVKEVTVNQVTIIRVCGKQ